MPRLCGPLVGHSALSALILTLVVLCPVQALAQSAETHPARIHSGACSSLGPVLFDLTAVGAATNSDGTPVPAAGPVGSAQAMPLLVSETALAMTLSDLVAEEHAIVVFESTEAPDQVIACGAIGGPLTMQMAGMVMPGDELAVGLTAPGEAGMAGLALIRAEGKTATIRVYLGNG